MLFGASYYHEYQPYERLSEDMRLMREAHFSVIRVGESTWSSYEPRPGEISFAALRRVVDAAADVGLKIIVGTPTYAIPAWMARLHPEVMSVDREGHTRAYGGRQTADFTSPTYLFYAERIIRAMAIEFGQDDAVIAFQLDNEIGAFELVNQHLFQRFKQELLDHFGSVDEINRRWGLTYWSHRLFEIDDLWGPQGNTNPSYALEWERFQARLASEFLTWQRDLVRPLIGANKEIFHDTVSGWGSRWSDPRAIAESLDKTATNIYVGMQEALTFPEAPVGVRGLAPSTHPEPLGAWQSLWKADTAYAQRGPSGSRFFVTEAQAGGASRSSCQVPAYPGQLRMLAHIFASRGAELLTYWHWHTLHYGCETYWGGVLGHDLEPNRVYRELAELGLELGQLAPELDGIEPTSDVAILHDRDSLEALRFMPPLPQSGSSLPDPSSYDRIFSRLYIGALKARLQCRVVFADSDWTKEPVLIVPALYIASDALLERLAAHARDGNHVIVTFRSGYANTDSVVRATRAPGPLRPAAGVSYQESATPPNPLALVVSPQGSAGKIGPLNSAPQLSPEAYAEAWVDYLEPESATPLWSYTHPVMGAYPALCTNEVGRGRMTWLGTLPDADSCAALLDWAIHERGEQAASATWGELPEHVRVTSAARKGRGRLWFIGNHSLDPVTVSLPREMIDLVTSRELGSTLTLSSWESRIIAETAEEEQ